MPLTMPTLDWALLPPLALIALPAFFASVRLYNFFKPTPASQPYNAETGIGRGAPGFLTGSKKVALPLEIIMRIKLGEEVTPEEITEALEKQQREEEEAERKRVREEERLEQEKAGFKTMKIPDSVDEDWLPAGATTVGKGPARRRKR